MNPFTEATVATPLPRRAWRHRAQGLRRRVGAAALAAGLCWAGAAQAVDANQATAETLQTIKGIGPKMAQSILEERRRGGPYASFDDLSDRVKGIGAKRAAALEAAGLKVSPSAAAGRGVAAGASAAGASGGGARGR